MASTTLLKAIAITAQIKGREFSPEAAIAYAEDLAGYPDAALIAAIERCRRELRGFPEVSDVLARIDDGRPNVEKAWALVQSGEDATIVWTEEMRDAWGIARLVQDDKFTAPRCFREEYLKLITESRSSKRPVKWEISLGQDKAQRESAIQDAVRRGWITDERASQYIALPAPSDLKQVTGPFNELSQMDPVEMLSKIRSRLTTAIEEPAAE